MLGFVLLYRYRSCERGVLVCLDVDVSGTVTINSVSHHTYAHLPLDHAVHVREINLYTHLPLDHAVDVREINVYDHVPLDHVEHV